MIDVREVRDILTDSFLRVEETTDGKPAIPIITAEGITAMVGFHPDRLMSHKERVVELIMAIPDIDQGISFLNMCFDKSGSQWGEHKSCEELLLLGLALNVLEYALPRDMWFSLPGGMPYIQLKKNASGDIVDV